MGQDWIQIDKEFSRKPATLRLMQLTGADLDQVTGRMVRFWSWVDDHVKSDGLMPLGFATLAEQFGGPPEFWEALLDDDVAWLARTETAQLRVTQFRKRFGKSSKLRKQARDRQRRKRLKDELLAAQKQATAVTRDTSRMSRPRREERRGEESNCSTTTADTTASRCAAELSKLAQATAEPLGGSVDQNKQATGSEQDPIKIPTPRPPTSTRIDWNRAEADATRWSAKLHLGSLSRLSAPDRNTLLKFAALAQDAGLEGMIAGAVAVSASKRNPMGYLTHVLKSEFADRQLDLMQWLRRTPVPAEIQNAEPRSLGSILALAAG